MKNAELRHTCGAHGVFIGNGGMCPDCNIIGHEAPVQHAAGGFRSEVMPYYAAIPAASLRRLALRATGAPKGETRTEKGREYKGGSDGFGYGNWARGLPMQDTLNHIYEHLNHWRDSIQAGLLPTDDDLSAIAWGVMMPLMSFERNYAEACDMRLRLISTAGPSYDPMEIDRLMEVRGLGKWLQPLSPKVPKEAKLAHERHQAATEMAANSVPLCYGSACDQHIWRWYDAITDEFKCDRCSVSCQGHIIREFETLRGMRNQSPRPKHSNGD